MTMNVTQEQVGDVLVVGPGGRLDGHSSRDLESVLSAAVDDGSRQILVDFSALEYISSSGLRVILATAKRLKKSQGDVILCQLNDNIRQVFEMSGFHTILNIQSSREAGISSFAQG